MKLSKSVCVILNEEKNLKTFSGCHQILRKAQDDKESLRLFIVVMTIGGEKVILYMVIRN